MYQYSPISVRKVLPLCRGLFYSAVDMVAQQSTMTCKRGRCRKSNLCLFFNLKVANYCETKDAQLRYVIV